MKDELLGIFCSNPEMDGEAVKQYIAPHFV